MLRMNHRSVCSVHESQGQENTCRRVRKGYTVRSVDCMLVGNRCYCEQGQGREVRLPRAGRGSASSVLPSVRGPSLEAAPCKTEANTQLSLVTDLVAIRFGRKANNNHNNLPVHNVSFPISLPLPPSSMPGIAAGCWVIAD